jgi:pimeloyl-ACP methyl ester carboxylesterase
MISLVNDGQLATTGPFKQTPDEVRRAMMGGVDMAAASGRKTKLLLYAHGGVTAENGGLQVIKDLKRVFAGTDVHPVVFVWRTDIASTLVNIVKDKFRTKGGPVVPREKLRFAWVREWLDRWVERIARRLRFSALWSQMKENARLSSERQDGGARIAAEALAERIAASPDTEIHIVGHSAGAILLAHMLRLFEDGKVPTTRRPRIASATLLGPACTVELFEDVYLRALRTGLVGRLRIVNLDDTHERADNVKFIYGKSILYLVQNSFEARGQKVLGLQETFWTEPGLQNLVLGRQVELAVGPNVLPAGSPFATGSTTHAGFAHDEKTLQGIRTVVLQGDPGAAPDAGADAD